MWQTKYASSVPSILGVGVDFRLCSEDNFLTRRPLSVIEIDSETIQLRIHIPPSCMKLQVHLLHAFLQMKPSTTDLALGKVNFEKNILLCKTLLKELQLKLMNSRATV